MITAGIDLASQPHATALCVIDWSAAPAQVTHLETDVDDDAIISVAAVVDKLGVDVPLGWPSAFVEAIAMHHDSGMWPLHYRHEENLSFRLRRTDLWVHEVTGRYPLSVATDRIASPAMRFAALLPRLAPGEPRDGSGQIVEAYPAAALWRWGFIHRGYKRAEGRATREALVDRFIECSSAWLSLDAAADRSCRESDDAFDALICALVARASARGLVEGIPDPDRVAGIREGWIALPRRETFSQLGT